MLKKLWKLFLVIAIVLFVVYFPAIVSTIGEWLTSAGFLSSASTIAGLANIPWWGAAAIGVGLAYLVDPGTVTEVVKSAGALASTVADTAASTVGSVATSVLSNLWPILLGVGAFFLITSGPDENKEAANA